MSFTLIIGNKNYSSWSLRPWLLMKQFGIEFNEIRIPLYQTETQSQISQYSDSGKVPVLIHNTLTIWDSLAICEYLAETFPNLNLYPQDKTARALARSISAEMHSGFQHLRQNMPMNCRASKPGKGMTQEVQKDIERITNIWRQLRRQFFQEGNMLFGKFTIADAMYAPVILRFKTYGVQLDSVCQDYSGAILELPAMQQWLEAAENEQETISASEIG
ncbi:glutathione S-transferase domain protein [Calothrix sp. NIES-4071]|nr:glutathione S-transferase domain protein [Calothrix sp. NIES-4071]BAZ63075.1 glutathione S-transferase domain protein [Calothrix sp. NIES-4105]